MSLDWKEGLEWARQIGPTIGLLLSAIGLGINGVGLLRTAKVSRNTFMLHFYDRVQKFNQIHLYLKEGWPGGSEGPASPEQWNEVKRYMGLFEGLWRVILDKSYPVDRADLDYSHRIVAIVRNPQIREELLEEESGASVSWGDFIALWKCLESGHVYRLIAADVLRKSGVEVPKAPTSAGTRRRFWHRAA